jgi:hypothetical protein
MVTTAVTKTITTLNEVESRFNLVRAVDPNFFDEWVMELPALSEAEKSELDRVRSRFRYHRAEGSLAEGVVNLMVLSPLLELAGFYDPPFRIRGEVPIELSVTVPVSEVEDETLRGRLDFLVVQQQLWLVVLESKGTAINLDAAIPQTLTYMMASPNPVNPIYGMVGNGGDFCFLKVDRQGMPQYDISDVFSYLPTRNRFYEVLQILKRLSWLIEPDAGK